MPHSATLLFCFTSRGGISAKHEIQAEAAAKSRPPHTGKKYVELQHIDLEISARSRVARQLRDLFQASGISIYDAAVGARAAESQAPR